MAAELERAHTPTNFLEAILAAVENEDSGFSDAEIFANTGYLLLAGEDTTVNTIAWAVHYFRVYPSHSVRVRCEVDARVAPGPALGDGSLGTVRVVFRSLASKSGRLAG